MDKDINAAAMAMENFHVDEFLGKQTEQKELKDVLQALCTMKAENGERMTRVLKEKTDAVIMLTENLQSIYTQIEGLQVPIEQLREEIKLIGGRVKESVKTCNSIYVSYRNDELARCYVRAMYSFKIVLRHTIKLFEEYVQNEGRDEFENLERTMFNYAIYATVVCYWRSMRETNSSQADNFALDMLSKHFREAYKVRDRAKLTRVMKLFVDLQLEDGLLNLIYEEIVMAHLPNILCEKYLAERNFDLALVYGDALDFLEKNVKILIDISRQELFFAVDVLLSCFWRAVDNCVTNLLPGITAAGNADLFFENYTKTQNFLISIGEYSGNGNLINEDHSFVEHMKRFNISVYYEIRHQTASSGLEIAIAHFSNFTSSRNSDGCVSISRDPSNELRLFVSQALCREINYLFGDNVFLPALSDMFIKSALLLMSRYLVWIQINIDEREKYRREEYQFMLAYFLRDMKLVENTVIYNYFLELPADDTISICRKIEKNALELMEAAFIYKQEQFAGTYNAVIDRFCNSFITEVVTHLQEVASIPRFYRRTNRNDPDKPSEYVYKALVPIDKLNTLFLKVKEKILLPENLIVVETILNTVSDEYRQLIGDVLNSIHRTEESLRRLKSRNTTVSARENSDDIKIKLQIQLDIEWFVKQIRLVDNEAASESLQALMDLAAPLAKPSGGDTTPI